MFDYIIKNGMVIDGSGAHAQKACVAIAGQRIAALGDMPDGCARQVIDAAGKYVTPGFIDIHRHGDMAVFRPGFGELELKQGLTTIVNGNCGMSAAPVDTGNAALLSYLRPVVGELLQAVDTESLDGYLESLRQSGPPINCGMLTGSGVVRAGLFGYDGTDIGPDGHKKLWQTLERELESGALGVSLGLGYAPECFCDTQELIRGLRPISNTNIPLTVHMREEGDHVCDAICEVVAIGRALCCPVHISHLKAMGKRNWHSRIPEALEIIRAAKEDGLDISCDVYPYTAGSTQLMHILPPAFIEGGIEKTRARLCDPKKRRELVQCIDGGEDFDNIAGMVGWDNIIMSALSLPENKRYEGMTVTNIARARGTAPLDCVCDMLVEENCGITMIDFITCEEDIARILRYGDTSVISDSIYPVSGRAHPRLYGTFTRILEKYVRHEGLLTIEEAVRRMSFNPAAALRLKGKGLLAPGMDADLNVFDLHELRERASYREPDRFSEGMTHVFVNGRPAILDGALTGGAFGRPVTRQS